ncbi:MAG: hypothetical protein ACRD0K_02500 [Egibacteraceae bacterium]
MGDHRSSVLIVAVAAKRFGELFDGSPHATIHKVLVGAPTGEDPPLAAELGWGVDWPAAVDRAL